MKNKIFALALIAVSLVSCTKNEDTTPVLKPKAVETATVSVPFTVQGQDNKTGKTVHGGLYAWISEIDVTTKSNDFAYNQFSTPFLMTGDAIGTHEANGDVVVGTYDIANVALGSNTFTVTTKTNSAQQLSFEQFAIGGVGANVDGTSRLDFLKTKDVYALYNANFNATIAHGANSLPSTMLTTSNARACAVFQISSALTALGVTANITATPSVAPTTALPIVTVDGGHDGSFFWSNAAAIGGTNVLYTVQLLDIHGNVFNTFTATLNLVASTSVNNLYTINESDITTNSVSVVFTAQPWDNQNGTPTIGN